MARLLLGLIPGLIRLRLCVFRMFLIAGWWKRLVARLLAGFLFRSLVFIARQILRNRSFARHILDWPWSWSLSRGAFNWFYAKTFVGINRSFLSVNIDRFAFEILLNRPRLINDRYVVYNQIDGTNGGAEAACANEHKESWSHYGHVRSNRSPADVRITVTPRDPCRCPMRSRDPDPSQRRIIKP